MREVTVPTLPCWSEHTWDVGFRARSPCGAWSLQLEDLLEPHFRSWCREACGGGRGEGAGSLIQEPMRLRSMARADPRPLLMAAVAARPPRRTEARGCCERRLGSGIPLRGLLALSDRAGHVCCGLLVLRWPGRCLPALRCDYRPCGHSLFLGWVRQDWERGLPCPSRSEWVQSCFWQPRGAPWRRSRLATLSGDLTSAVGPG